MELAMATAAAALSGQRASEEREWARIKLRLDPF
jgi:hypothetical protein